MRNEEDRDLLVEERPDGVYITSDGGGRTFKWWRTLEALHTILARSGAKRVGKQQGSDIGGVYTK